MVEPSIDECLHLLKLKRGVDFSSVKQAYRKNLYKCHPDRFQGRPDLLPVAERKTKRLVQVYGILEQWYQVNGGVGRAEPNGKAEQGPFPASGESPVEEEASARSSRSLLGLFAAVVVAVLALLVWRFDFDSGKGNKPAPIAGAAGVAATPAVESPTGNATQQKQLMPQAQTPLESRTAELNAMVAERDRLRSEWAKGYVHDWEVGRSAAERELAAAQAQYDRYVQDNASGIRDAKDATGRQVEEAGRASAAARDAFAKQEQVDLEAQRRSYDDWLLARGREAVALVKEIRRRESSDAGVFSDTEDPRKIFEFWTAEEAGGREINIAAKTGVAVLQPNDRFFPHFRSNIFLYGTEGQILVRMMGTIVEKHDALLKAMGERKIADRAELANWDAMHPTGPIQLGQSLQRVTEGLGKAMERLVRARTRLESEKTAPSLSKINEAFGQSQEGIKWASRISDAQDAIEMIKGAH